MRNIWLGSLKHSPGLLKEINCLASCFDSKGFEVTLLLHTNYEQQNQSEICGLSHKKNHYARLSVLHKKLRQLRASRPSAIGFYNSHPLNLLFYFFCMIILPSCKRFLVLHEPCKENAIGSYGGYALVIYLITVFNKIQSWFCTDLIVLSPYAEELLSKTWGYNKFCKTHCARILLPQHEKNIRSHPQDPRYLTFVGNVNKTKKLDWFLDLIKFSNQRGTKHQFLLVTASDLTEYKAKEPINNLANLVIHNPQTLSDGEISKFIDRSQLVFCLHESVTQSGVFVECMRHGVPVVCLNSPGFSQFMAGCGAMVPSSQNMDGILDAVQKVIINRAEMVGACQEVFRANFDCSMFDFYYEYLIRRIT